MALLHPHHKPAGLAAMPRRAGAPSLSALRNGSCIPSAKIAAAASRASSRSATTNRRAAATAALRPRALLSLFAPPAGQQQKQKKQANNNKNTAVPPECQRAQDQILAALSSAKGRGREGLSPEQLASLDAAVAVLEASGKGQRGAASQPALDGLWRLVFTSRPGSASPIQRTFVGVDSFSVYQDVSLSDLSTPARCDNVVVFGGGGGGSSSKKKSSGKEGQGASSPSSSSSSPSQQWANYLRVEAQASTQARPLDGFTPREGAGLPLFGKSFNLPPAAGPGARVDFAFDRAAFNLLGGALRFPYPVPFRLLGDERKGWLDVTYLSRDGRFRLSRGNKGTLFILLKEEEAAGEAGTEEEEDIEVEARAANPPANAFLRFFSPSPPPAAAAAAAPSVDEVLDAARASAAAPSDADKAREALGLVERLVAAAAAAAQGGQGAGARWGRKDATSSSSRRPARDARAHGTWRLVWSQQSETASALQRWGASQANSYQVIDAIDRGLAMNVVDLRPFAEVRAFATCEPLSDARTAVRIAGGELVLAPGAGGGGGLRVPLPIKGSDAGFIDWLYLDDGVRVTRGSKGSLFLHVRESDDATSIPDS